VARTGQVNAARTAERIELVDEYAEKDIKVTFADVAGVDEAKQELAEVILSPVPARGPAGRGRARARHPRRRTSPRTRNL
jgi:hypothetical protein